MSNGVRHGLVTSLAMMSLLLACGEAPVDEAEEARRAEQRALAENPLFRPDALTATAPDTFRVRLETSEGPVVVRAVRAWAPHGADRFYNLVTAGYYDGVRFHRVLPGFVAEFGINPDPRVNAVWKDELIVDDPASRPNARGTLSFAKSGANSRTAMVFINLRDNASLDEQGFSPFAEVVEGMDVVERLYAEYGDGPPRGEGVYKAMAQARGEEYFEEEFPELDRIERAVVVEGG